ncbi:MAG: GLUG motif-containing protein, partial [Cloacibacillus sp.]
MSEAGGVAGYVRGSTVINSVADCLVTSNCGKGSAGGIVGLVEYNSSILNCYSSGTLVAAQTTARLGGIAGTGTEVTIENCISSAVLSGDTAVKGGIIGNSDGSRINLKNCGWLTVTADKAYGSGNPDREEDVQALTRINNCVTSFTGVSPFISADRNAEGAFQIFRTWPGSGQNAVSSMVY